MKKDKENDLSCNFEKWMNLLTIEKLNQKKKTNIQKSLDELYLIEEALKYYKKNQEIINKTIQLFKVKEIYSPSFIIKPIVKEIEDIFNDKKNIDYKTKEILNDANMYTKIDVFKYRFQLNNVLQVLNVSLKKTNIKIENEPLLRKKSDYVDEKKIILKAIVNILKINNVKKEKELRKENQIDEIILILKEQSKYNIDEVKKENKKETIQCVKNKNDKYKNLMKNKLQYKK